MPDAGLSSYAVLVGDDGATLLHFSQRRDSKTAPDQDLMWKHEVDAAVPGIERLGVTMCRLHRRTPIYGRPEDARCGVLVNREFDGPDITRAEKLVDAMFAGSAQTPPAAGMIAAHFFVSIDGAKVFNYALWTSARAHQQAIDNVPAQLAADEQWQQAHSWPGLLTTSFQRFRPHLLLAQPES